MIDEHHARSASGADIKEIRDLFLRHAVGETAHDIGVIESVLANTPAGQPDPVNLVARAYCFWGREAVVDHLRTVFAGTWRFEPEENAIRILPSEADVAHIRTPTCITIGSAGSIGRRPPARCGSTANS